MRLLSNDSPAMKVRRNWKRFGHFTGVANIQTQLAIVCEKMQGILGLCLNDSAAQTILIKANKSFKKMYGFQMYWKLYGVSKVI